MKEGIKEGKWAGKQVGGRKTFRTKSKKRRSRNRAVIRN